MTCAKTDETILITADAIGVTYVDVGSNPLYTL